jgi:hypothetical protein
MGQLKIFGLTYIQVLGALAAIIAIVSAFLTWVTISGTGTSVISVYPYYQTVPVSQSYSGTYGFPSGVSNYWSYINSGGIFTAILSFITLGIVFSDNIEKMVGQSNSVNNVAMGMVKRFSNIVLIAFGAIILLIALNNISAIGSMNATISQSSFLSLVGASGSVSVGIGLYLTLVAGLIILVCGFLGLKVQRENERSLAKNNPMQQQQYGPANNPVPQNPQYPPMQQQQYGPANNPVPQNPQYQQTGQQSPPVQQGPKFCPGCGSQTNNAVFCAKCGKKVK